MKNNDRSRLISDTELLKAVLPNRFIFFSASFLPNWHIEAIAYTLEQVRCGKLHRVIINVPPRYLKSICASVAFPAFVLGHDPTTRIICVSYSESLARSHANDFRALVHSERYRLLFPGTHISKSKDTETEVKMTARGFRYSTSVGGTLTGRGGNILILDDPQKPQDAHSEVARLNTQQWFFNTLFPRLDSKVDDAIIIVMQRLHVDDLSAKLMEQGGWHVLNLPAIAAFSERIELGGGRFHLRVPGDVLHPEREPLTALEQIKQGMGSLDFAAQYQQAPVPPEGNLIRWSWFNFYDDYPAKGPNDKIVVSWDTAMSSKELSSYSACVVMQVRNDNTIYILDVIRKQLEYPELRRLVIQTHLRWQNACSGYALLIENKGSGMSLIQDLKRECQINAIAVDPTADKIVRMAAQTAKLESGQVNIPRRAAWLAEFQKELMSFPRGSSNDQVDALAQGLKYVSESAARRLYWGPLKGLC